MAAWAAASLMAAAHVVESFPFFLFATCVAVMPACLRSRRALCRILRAFSASRAVARSMRVSALLSFRITLSGMDCSTHAGLVSAAPRTQRGVVQGSVGVLDDGGVTIVVDVGGELLVVVLDGQLGVVVDVVGTLLVTKLGTAASRRISPSPSAT